MTAVVAEMTWWTVMFKQALEDGGRKWVLCQQVFWISTLMTVGAEFLFIKKGLDPMPPLYWWSSVQGGLFALYGAANIITKKVANGGTNVDGATG